MRGVKLYLCLLLLFAVLRVQAQQQDDNFYRLELGAGLGASLNKTDVDSKMSFAGALIVRFPLNPRMAVKTQFTYNQMKGTTQGMKPFLPANPNATGTERLSYEVNKGIYDVSALYELHF